mmetsp:Transcript_30707/g.60446  ORF Transcript_30707/g.60446 Transcript_30707/m.60446 type:complete len:86 (+) Transcript_30707:297-554(+)
MRRTHTRKEKEGQSHSGRDGDSFSPFSPPLLGTLWMPLLFLRRPSFLPSCMNFENKLGVFNETDGRTEEKKFGQMVRLLIELPNS